MIRVKDLVAGLMRMPADAEVILEAPDVIRLSDVYLDDLGRCVIRGQDPNEEPA